MLTLIHRDSCSKSQCLLQYLEEHKIPFIIRDYLQHPLTALELEKLLDELEEPAAEIVRINDNSFMPISQSVNLEDRSAVIELLVRRPELLQRPILSDGTTAAIGRPFEKALVYLASLGFPSQK